MSAVSGVGFARGAFVCPGPTSAPQQWEVPVSVSAADPRYRFPCIGASSSDHPARCGWSRAPQARRSRFRGSGALVTVSRAALPRKRAVKAARCMQDRRDESASGVRAPPLSPGHRQLGTIPTAAGRSQVCSQVSASGKPWKSGTSDLTRNHPLLFSAFHPNRVVLRFQRGGQRRPRKHWRFRPHEPETGVGGTPPGCSGGMRDAGFVVAAPCGRPMTTWIDRRGPSLLRQA